MEIRLNDFAKIDSSVRNSKDIVFYEQNELLPEGENYEYRKDFHAGVNEGKALRWGTGAAARHRNEVTWNKLKSALTKGFIGKADSVDAFLTKCGLKDRMDAHDSLRSRDVKVVMNNVFAERFNDIMDSLADIIQKRNIKGKVGDAILSAFKYYCAGIMAKRDVATNNKFVNLLNEYENGKKDAKDAKNRIESTRKAIEISKKKEAKAEAEAKDKAKDMSGISYQDDFFFDDSPSYSEDEDLLEYLEDKESAEYSEEKNLFGYMYTKDLKESNDDIAKLNSLVVKSDITDIAMNRLNKLDARTVINQLATCNKEDLTHKCLEFLQEAGVIKTAINFEIVAISNDVDKKITESKDSNNFLAKIFNAHLSETYPSFSYDYTQNSQEIFTTLLKAAQLFSKYSNEERLKTKEGKAKLREVMMEFSDTIASNDMLSDDMIKFIHFTPNTETQRWQDLLAIAKLYKEKVDNQISLEFFEIMAVESLGLDTMSTTLEENQVILKQTSKEKSDRFMMLSPIAKDFMKELTTTRVTQKHVDLTKVYDDKIISRNTKLLKKDGEIIIQSNIKVKRTTFKPVTEKIEISQDPPDSRTYVIGSKKLSETFSEREKGIEVDDKIGDDLKNILKNMGFEFDEYTTFGKEEKITFDKEKDIILEEEKDKYLVEMEIDKILEEEIDKISEEEKDKNLVEVKKENFNFYKGIVNNYVDYCNNKFEEKFKGKEHKTFDKLNLDADYSNDIDKQKRVTELKNYLSYLNRGNVMTVKYKQNKEEKTKKISSYDMSRRDIDDNKKVAQWYEGLMEVFNNNETMILAVCHYINELTPDVQLPGIEAVNNVPQLDNIFGGKVISAAYRPYVFSNMRDILEITVNDDESITIERIQKRSIGKNSVIVRNDKDDTSDELENVMRTFHTKVTLKPVKIKGENNQEEPCVALEANLIETAISKPKIENLYKQQ